MGVIVWLVALFLSTASYFAIRWKASAREMWPIAAVRVFGLAWLMIWLWESIPSEPFPLMPIPPIVLSVSMAMLICIDLLGRKSRNSS